MVLLFIGAKFIFAMEPWQQMSMNPLEQFAITQYASINVGSFELAVTNQAIWVMGAALFTSILLLVSSRKRAMIPSRMQSFAEMTYELIEGMITSTSGREGLKYLPLVMTLMLFIATINLLGMVPGSYTSTSQMAVCGALALMVFALVWIIGFARHGLHFFSLFLPAGTPLWLAPLIIPLEMISFFARPFTLTVRLAANMMAGHMLLKIFAGFAVMLAGLGATGIIGAMIPGLVLVALTGFEIFVALLQAYIFTILACVYLNDAINLH